MIFVNITGIKLSKCKQKEFNLNENNHPIYIKKAFENNDVGQSSVCDFCS